MAPPSMRTYLAFFLYPGFAHFRASKTSAKISKNPHLRPSLSTTLFASVFVYIIHTSLPHTMSLNASIYLSYMPDRARNRN